MAAKQTQRDPDRARAQARREFDAWAASYDRSLLNHFLFRPSYLTLMEEIARWRSENDRPFRVLDVGCGTGTLAGLLAATDWPVTCVGLDYSPAMCVQASVKAERAEATDRAKFTTGDSEHLPFADESFDIVTCSNSFHHYPHQQNVVTDMRRVLRPRGRLILIDGFRDNIIGWVVFDVIITAIEKDVYHAPWTVMNGYFEKSGLSNIRRQKFNILFPAFVTIGDRP